MVKNSTAASMAAAGTVISHAATIFLTASLFTYSIFLVFLISFFVDFIISFSLAINL